MFKLTELENGLENVQGFYCGATNVGMRTNPANSGVSDVDGD
ncbi:MAG TPA: bifunctional ornithine acetyltransferase/N-acetylglutamate synthase, partial [Epsilonproteobacteria bacterium]|nr:bifunctional ornithine acetyltransferase/N-acetylglutamate synthase [Campylobacterota bacterium]